MVEMRSDKTILWCNKMFAKVGCNNIKYNYEPNIN